MPPAAGARVLYLAAAVCRSAACAERTSQSAGVGGPGRRKAEPEVASNAAGWEGVHVNLKVKLEVHCEGGGG